MHLRLSSAIGTSIIDDHSHELLGVVSGILVHPDTGAIEGFYVMGYPMDANETAFLATIDIVHWGTHVHVRSEDVIAPLEDRIRLFPLLEDGRTILGQKIRTEGGRPLGRCADVQFGTKTWHIEWLFPRRFFRWGTPLPIVEVQEVRRDAIIVKDSIRPIPAKSEVPAAVDTVSGLSVATRIGGRG